MDREDDTPDLSKLSGDSMEQLVTHTAQKSARERRKAAKQPATRAYLQAALKLIAREFKEEARVDADGDETDNPWFDWLSRPKVAAEIDLTAFPGGDQLEDLDEATRNERIASRMRNVWDPQRNFLADLLSVGLAIDHWSSPTVYNEDLLAGLLTSDLADAIHAIAFDDLQQVAMRDLTSFRLQLIAIANADRDPILRESLRESYARINGEWSALYQAVLDAHSRRLRDGLTVSDMADMLTAAAEGLALRLITDPSSSVRNESTRTSLLGTMAMSVWLACTTDDADDHRTIEDLIRHSANNTPEQNSRTVERPSSEPSA